MINPRPNVFCLFLILLISCSDVAASIVADKTNSGVTAFPRRNEIHDLMNIHEQFMNIHELFMNVNHIWFMN